MHELSIVQGIVDIIKEVAHQNGIKKIRKVNIEIGPLSGIVEQSIHFCWDIALKKTGLDGVALEIQKIPLTILCHKCGKKSVLDRVNLSCLHCGENDVEVIIGREVNIKSIEV